MPPTQARRLQPRSTPAFDTSALCLCQAIVMVNHPGVPRSYLLSSCPAPVLVAFLLGGHFHRVGFKDDMHNTRSYYLHRDVPYLTFPAPCTVQHGSLLYQCFRVDLRCRKLGQRILQTLYQLLLSFKTSRSLRTAWCIFL